MGATTGVPSAVRHTRTVPSRPPPMMTGVRAVLAGQERHHPRRPARPDRHRHDPRLGRSQNRPSAVAMAIFDGAADGQEEIFPGPVSAAIEHGWHDGVIKTLERQNAAAVQAVSVQA